MSRPDISFIILTWNSKRHLASCLDSIVSSMAGEQYRFEIIIIDNGSKDGTVELLKTYEKSHKGVVKPVFMDKNTGTTYPRNIALRQCGGRYIVIMDSDVVLPEGTVERLVNVLRENASVGLAAPRLNYGSGKLQKSTDIFPTLLNKVKRYFFLKAIESRENREGAGAGMKDVDYAISAMWVMRRDIVDKVGLLDEKIFYAPEDVDYCLRIWKAGYRVVYVPDVTGIHHAQEISRGFRLNKATINHILGLCYYFRKHGYIFTGPKFC